MRLTARRSGFHPRPVPQRMLFAATCALLAALSLSAGPALAASATEVRHGPTDRPKIALTFDDNYNVPRALAVIDVLERYDTKATTFG